eukprot:gene14294-biopygen5762
MAESDLRPAAGNPCISYNGVPRGGPAEVPFNSKSMNSLGNTAFRATEDPQGAAARARALAESIGDPLGKPYQTNGFLKAHLQVSAEVAFCAKGIQEEVTFNSKSMESLGFTAFRATANPHGPAGRAPAPSGSIEASFGKTLPTQWYPEGATAAPLRLPERLRGRKVSGITVLNGN